MNLLLDTHIALWAIIDDPRLPAKARELISDRYNNIYYSSVSVWEILLKSSSPNNNFHLSPSDFVQYCEESGYYPLNMAAKHVIEASKLNTSDAESHGHKDSFDRLLLAQAKSENYSFLTHDTKMQFYHENEKCGLVVKLIATFSDLLQPLSDSFV